MTNLLEQINNNIKTVITAPEGTGKTSTVLRELITAGVKCIFSSNSFVQLKEKQEYLKKTYGLTDQDVPIIAKAITEANRSYVTNPSNPSYLSGNEKVVLVSHSFIMKEQHKQLGLSNLVTIIDEFDPWRVIVPSVHQLVTDELTEKGEVDINKFCQGISRKYSSTDASMLYSQLNNESPEGNKAFIVSWISNHGASKLVFITSEKLPVHILTSLGFVEIKLDVPSVADRYFQVFPAAINDTWFEEMKATKAWDTITNYFDTVISDKDKEGKAIPHIVAKGSNNHIGKSVLTVVSQVPTAAINRITHVLNEVTTIAWDFKTVFALYYRDKLAQSVCRNVGLYRGNGPAYVAINKEVWDVLEAKYDELDFPISYKLWQPDNITNLISQVANISAAKRKQIREAKKEKVSAALKQKKQVLQNITDSQIQTTFERDINGKVYMEELRQYAEKNNLLRPTGKLITLGDVAKVFNLPKPKGVRQGKERTYVLEGVKLK